MKKISKSLIGSNYIDKTIIDTINILIDKIETLEKIVQRERLNEEDAKKQYGQMGTCSTDENVVY